MGIQSISSACFNAWCKTDAMGPRIGVCKTHGEHIYNTLLVFKPSKDKTKRICCSICINVLKLRQVSLNGTRRFRKAVSDIDMGGNKR